MGRRAPKGRGLIHEVDEWYPKGRPPDSRIKQEVWMTPDGDVARYSLAYIEPFGNIEDNGRVLGYDNAHGYHHRHFLGTVEPCEYTTFEALAERFFAELETLWSEEDD